MSCVGPLYEEIYKPKDLTRTQNRILNTQTIGILGFPKWS